jgi:Arc/MetJ-type ribon-helix-helix transcriptional regulator
MAEPGYDEQGNPIVQGEIHAVGSMAGIRPGHGGLSGKDKAAHIERAMSEAVQQAIKEGVPLSASDAIRARMMAAREDILLKIADHEARVQKEQQEALAQPKPDAS